MALHIALGLPPWAASPLPIEVTVLGIDEDDVDPEDREHYRDNLKALKLQKKLLALCGWPDCRTTYEDELRKAEEYATYCRKRVENFPGGEFGTGTSPAERQESLERALAQVEYRRELLEGLEAVQAKWTPTTA
jgi:hypothetical protein